MGFFDELGRAAQSAWNDVEDVAETVVEGAERVAGWAADRAAEVTDWFGDLFAGNVGTQAVEASALVEAVLGSRGAPAWHEGAHTADELANEHNDIGNQIGQIGSGLQAVWTGRGAEAAQAKLRPLADVVDAAARTFTTNATNLSGMAHGFDHLKSSLVPLPPKPHKNFGDVMTPWDTDTEDQINAYNRTAQENLDRYSAYAEQARAGSQQLKIDYGQLGAFGDGDFTVGQAAGPGKPPERHKVGSPRGAAGKPPDGSSAGDQAPPHEPGSSPSPGPGSSPGDTEPGAVAPADHTRPAAQVPSTGQVTSPAPGLVEPPGSGNSMPPGGSGGLGLVGGRGSSGALPGGSGTARTPGGAVTVGPGRGTGAALPGGGAGRGPGVSVKGSASSRGIPGAGGLATGPGGARGGEDREHERRYGLVDDQIFKLDERGDRLLDPTTGLPVTPPTIGG